MSIRKIVVRNMKVYKIATLLLKGAQDTNSAVTQNFFCACINLYVDSRRATHNPKKNAGLSTPMKAGVFFTLFLIYFGIFYYFEDAAAKPKVPFNLGFSKGGGNEPQITEASRIQGIRNEDCYDGIAPF